MPSGVSAAKGKAAGGRKPVGWSGVRTPVGEEAPAIAAGATKRPAADFIGTAQLILWAGGLARLENRRPIFKYLDYVKASRRELH